MRTCQKCDGKGTIEPNGDPSEKGGVAAALKCNDCDGEGMVRTMIDDLRDLADFFEQRPEFPLPSYGATFNVRVMTKEDFFRFARMMGQCKKEVSDTYMWLKKEFGIVSVDLFTDREVVCVRTQIGTRTIAAQPATLERTEPIYEWECPKIFRDKSDPEPIDLDEAAALAGSNQPKDDLAADEHDEARREDAHDSDWEARAIDDEYERAREAGTLPDEVDEHGVRIDE